MIGSSEFKVGLLVVVVGAIIAGLTMKVSDGAGLFESQKTYHFIVENASGLVPNSAVRMAGIRIGKISAIELEEGKAKVFVEIGSDLAFSEEGFVQIRPQGLLGDKIVELYPGPLTAKPLPDGAQIRSATDRGSIDDVVGEVGAIAKSLGDLAKTISNASSGSGDDSTPIGRIILNLEKVTSDLAEVTDQNKSKVGEVMDSLTEITRTLDEIINNEGEKGFRIAWSKAADSVDKLNDAMTNLSEASRKLNSGQGTLGRLINDDEVLDKVNTTMDSVNEFLGGASDLETSVGYHAEYNADASSTKSYLDIKIQPGLDRYYLLQIISDPLGVSRSSKTTTDDGTAPPSTEDRTVISYSDLKLSLLFAKNFYNFTLKGGIIENTGGFGFDYYMLRRKLKLSLDLYSFDDLKTKAYIKYDVWKGIYVIAGADDVTDSVNSNSFLGAGLFITNDDLKLFASKVSF